MAKSRRYNIQPAPGQALLNFEGRHFPDKVEVFETELIEEARCKSDGQQSLLEKESDVNADFRNRLIQGDCLSACAYLKEQNIKIDLVYIDPPFASGANYAKKIYLRNGGNVALKHDGNSIGEEVMYDDIWRKEDYLNWIYERLLAIREVMSETASIYVHLDWRIGHYVKILMDEVFGENNFLNEIIWAYRIQGVGDNSWARKHNTIYLYKKGDGCIFNHEKEKVIYEKPFIDTKKDVSLIGQLSAEQKNEIIEDIKNSKSLKTQYKKYLFDVHYSCVRVRDVWDGDYTKPFISGSNQYLSYPTQKPEGLLERIIKASSNEGMVIADFFSGSGTTAKVAHDLNRRFIACDIGINAIQTTRDRLCAAKADFDIYKIRDGLRLIRNPHQTEAIVRQIFGLIKGFSSREQLSLNQFWDGGIAQPDGNFTPIKFTGVNEKLTVELFDYYLEQIYHLQDTNAAASGVMIVYAYKDAAIDEQYLKGANTQLSITLKSLDELLAEDKDKLFTSDTACIDLSKDGNEYKVEIKRFFSPYLNKKIDEFNDKTTKKGTLDEDLSKEVVISPEGLELIESVQFDTTLTNAWRSNPHLEDTAGKRDKIRGTYLLDTDQFKIKIRNIAGDEIIIDSKDIPAPS